MSDFKPMLSAAADLNKLDYSNLWLSPKLDGIRAIVRNGVVLSRNLKPIRNKHVQHLFGRSAFENLDGELIVGSPTDKNCYQITNSGVMSADGEPDVQFYVFDKVHVGVEYLERYKQLRLAPKPRGMALVHQTLVGNRFDLQHAEEHFLDQGYEGVMLRAYHGPSSYYKFGRSTVKEGGLLKLKRFVDSEAKVVGFEEEMANMNEASTDALGHTKRSAHAEGKVGKGRLGALVCETPEGVRFNIGTGFDAAQRELFWRERDKLIGQLAKYKHFPIGVKDAPRFPVFLGWRDEDDS